MTNPKPAVILAAAENGLGAIRSLAKARIPVIAVAQAPDDLPLLSRYPIRKISVPAPKEGDSDEPLLQVLKSIQEDQPVLIPTADKLVAFMLRNREVLQQQYRFVLPDSALVEGLLDKSRETELISGIGIPLPRTVTAMPVSAAELLELLPLPIIVKPRSFAEKKFLGQKTVRLRTRDEVEAFYKSHAPFLAAFVAQEIIPGGDDCTWMCHCTFNHSHQLVQAFTMRRWGMAPSHYGVTSHAISEYNAEVIELSRQIGEKLEYCGPMGVDFKLDTRDGTYKYIELDPRIQLCNYLDTVCGVNNVLHTYWLSQGVDLPPRTDRQREGVVFLNIYNDCYARLKDGEAPLAILRRYLSESHRRHVGGSFQWGDLRPGSVMAWRYTREVMSSAMKRIRKPARPAAN